MLITTRVQRPAYDKVEYGKFKPTDIDPTTGRKIIYIAYQTDSLYVSIDDAMNLNWSASKALDYPEGFGKILSHVSLTEALVDRIFVGKRNRLAYKKILAEVLARLLDRDTSSAEMIMKEAKQRVLAHSKERVRMAYINNAVLSVILVGVVVILITLFKTQVLGAVGGDKEILKIILCTLLGGIGAFITTFLRFQNYRGSIISGLPIHRLDGCLRVFYGLVAGLLISLAIKGKVLAAFADSDSPWILFFFAMIAGASEVLIPNLVRQVESQTTLKRVDTIISDPIVPDIDKNNQQEAVIIVSNAADGKNIPEKNGVTKVTGEPVVPHTSMPATSGAVSRFKTNGITNDGDAKAL